MQRVWAAFAKDPEHALYEDPFGFPQYNSLSKCFPSLLAWEVKLTCDSRTVTDPVWAQ